MTDMAAQVTEAEQAVRTQLAQLLARYDGVIPPAVYPTIRSLQVELAWREHRGRKQMKETSDGGMQTLR
jgi:hypothetical protein